MAYVNYFVVLMLFYLSNPIQAQEKQLIEKTPKMNSNFSIALHGGAGNMAKKNLTPEKEAEYKAKLQEAIDKGRTMLADGAEAVDAVEAVIKILEDSPLFNAGKGSVFAHDGTNQMDAAIMDGKTLDAGTLTNVRTIKNPISAAKLIMQKSKFVFLSAKGAEKFAKENNIEIVDTSYFFYQSRWDEFIKIRDSKKVKLDNDSSTGMLDPFNSSIDKYGTVGCVVLDRYGNLAAGTSTGGIVNKDYNRIGDSPIIGAGTYANNKTCAISCTGHGEDFIKIVAAHDVSALIEYKHLKLKTAVARVIKKLTDIKGRGGLIAIDHKGNIVMDMNTNGMFRASANQDGILNVSIYK
jgi:beta-aspartyl-peptidase (threonine type)